MSDILIASRDPKGQELMRQSEVALNAANLSEDGAQRVIERGREFQTGFIKLLKELSMSTQYADEERSSNYTYPPEYGGPRPVGEQIVALAVACNLDPSRALEYVKNLPELPNGAEGWFAIPSVDAIAMRHFPKIADPAERYCHAVQFVLGKIAESRSFYNYREGQITPAYLTRSDRTAQALTSIAAVQGSDILIVAAQLGLRHRGRSVRRAREVFVPSEFGLGSLEVGSIVLTHPERLVRWEELQMDLAGDEFLGAVGEPSAPCLDCYDDEVKFDARWIGYPSEGCGSVSGFFPQCLVA